MKKMAQQPLFRAFMKLPFFFNVGLLSTMNFAFDVLALSKVIERSLF
jgi:hypothetical protein